MEPVFTVKTVYTKEEYRRFHAEIYRHYTPLWVAVALVYAL